jgi:hypothetical protein
MIILASVSLYLSKLLKWSPVMLAIIIMGSDGKKDPYRVLQQDCLVPGERIEYRVHYGFINAGEAVLAIDDEVHQINERACYKIDVKGRTKGLFDMVTRVRDHWGTYLDTTAIVSQRFYQSIKEGKYLKKEVIEFDQINHAAVVNRLDKKDSSLIKKDTIKTLPHMQDLVSGYYYMRTFNFDTMKLDDIFTVTGFFDDTTYHVDVKFLGRDKLKTKIGTFDTFLMSPIMPKNSFFRGKTPVKAWISDDRLRIPLKVKAELIIGSLEIDVRSYEN